MLYIWFNGNTSVFRLSKHAISSFRSCFGSYSHLSGSLIDQNISDVVAACRICLFVYKSCNFII